METTFEREVLDRLTKIETKLDSFDNAKKKTYENENEIIQLKNDVKNQGDRILELEDSNKWLHRTTAGAVIGSLVAIVFALVQAGIGV